MSEWKSQALSQVREIYRGLTNAEARALLPSLVHGIVDEVKRLENQMSTMSMTGTRIEEIDSQDVITGPGIQEIKSEQPGPVANPAGQLLGYIPNPTTGQRGGAPTIGSMIGKRPRDEEQNEYPVGKNMRVETSRDTPQIPLVPAGQLFGDIPKPPTGEQGGALTGKRKEIPDTAVEQDDASKKMEGTPGTKPQTLPVQQSTANSTRKRSPTNGRKAPQAKRTNNLTDEERREIHANIRDQFLEMCDKEKFSDMVAAKKLANVFKNDPLYLLKQIKNLKKKIEKCGPITP